MKILEKYTGERVYMFPNGVLATKEAVLKSFPSCLTFAFVVETDENHEVMWAMQNLSAMRSMYNIDTTLSEEEAISALQEIINTPEEVDDTPTAEERIASALEFQTMMMLPDEE